jgi:protein-disulfide isomerase
MAAKRNRAAERAERAEKAAALLREQRARERRRNLVTGGVVAAVLAALVVVGILISSGGDDDVDTSLPVTEAGGSDYGLTVGDADAPNEIVIYEDFLCPFCGELEAQANERLSALADEGKVYIDYRPFNLLSSLGDYSARSASAFAVVLEESGPEVAKAYHDLLFAEQPEEGDEPYPDADWLVEKAVEAGAEEAAVRPGIEAGASDWVEQATDEAEESGVRGTPTVLLNGEKFTDYRTVDDLADNLVAAVD